MNPPQLSPDEFMRVLSAARSGDRVAGDKLFQAFYSQVEQMVHRRLAHDLRQNRPWLRTRFSTGDVVQEVFRSVLRDLGAFGGSTPEAFCGYLAMVVRNRILDAIRFHQAARRDGRLASSLERVDDEAADDSPLASAAGREQLDRFTKALDEFPEREQLLLRARLEGEESFEELRDQLGFSSTSATQRAFYAAKAKLALMLGNGGAPE